MLLLLLLLSLSLLLSLFCRRDSDLGGLKPIASSIFLVGLRARHSASLESVFQFLWVTESTSTRLTFCPAAMRTFRLCLASRIWRTSMRLFVAKLANLSLIRRIRQELTLNHVLSLTLIAGHRIIDTACFSCSLFARGGRPQMTLTINF